MDYEIIHRAKYLIWGVYHVCEHVFTMYAVYTSGLDPIFTVEISISYHLINLWFL